MGAATAQAQTVTMNDVMDESEETQEVIVGGKGVLLQMLLDLALKAIHLPSELFDK